MPYANNSQLDFLCRWVGVLYLSKYSESLKDPRWWRKRKKVMERDGNKCTVCGSKKKLNVHHTFYYSDNPAPWLYPLSSLLTVCENCHTDFHLHHEIEIKKAKSKTHYSHVKKDISGMYYFEVESINKKGSWSFNCFYANDRKQARIKIEKKGNRILNIKRVKLT